MIRDEDLKSSADYSKGQTEAAKRVLVELVNLFDEYKDEIRIVGGWVPDLLFPNEGHVGSVDVDVLINHLRLNDTGYLTMRKILLKNGYREHPDKYFSFIKTIRIDEADYDVDVDILAGIYGGTPKGKRSQHVQGIKALKATGGNFAFEFDGCEVRLESARPDGAMDAAYIKVVAIVPYLVMKAAALGRGKAKDAYDIYFLLKHYPGGPTAVAALFGKVRTVKLVQDMKTKLEDKFASVHHAGAVDVADFLEVEAEERDIVLRDSYEQVRALLDRI